MLFLQALLFFLLSTPAFALFGLPEDSKGGSASGAQPNQRPSRPHRPSAKLAAAIPVAGDIVTARGVWRHDYLLENKQMRRVMFVKGVGGGHNRPAAAIIQLREVEITNAENQTPPPESPESWRDLTSKEIEKIIAVEWNRDSDASGNFRPGQLGQTAKCTPGTLNKDDKDVTTVKITVHEPFPVETGKMACGDWYSDDPNQRIRQVMQVRGGGNRRIILLGVVEITAVTANDLTLRPKSWKDLTSQDTKDIINREWKRYTDRKGNIPDSQVGQTAACETIVNKDKEVTAVKITVTTPSTQRVRKKQKTG